MLSKFYRFIQVCGFSVVFVALALGCHAAVKQAPPHLLRARLGSVDPLRLSLADMPHVTPPQGTRARIVQFWSPVSPEKRAALLGRGLTLRGYIPDDALLVMASDDDVTWLTHQSMVRTVVDQPVAWRLAPGLLRATHQGLRALVETTPQTLYVELSDMGVAAQVQDAVRALGGEILDGASGSRVLRVRLAASQAAVLAEHPNVLAVEPARTAHTLNDQSYGMVQAGVLHHAPIWDMGLHGEGQLAAICDVGVNTNSCFFPSDKIADYQAIDNTPAHDVSHGTHVAGSLVGDRLGNGTYDLDDGMAPAARLIVQDAGTQVVGELSLPADFANVLLPAFNKGARVHVDSWGVDSDAYTVLERSLDAFIAAHRDMLVVVAQGNSGTGAGSVGSPATAKNIISAGAYDSTAPDDVANFSAHGPTSDGRIKPTLLAPGVQVVSADATQACGLVAKSGTSMAAPMVGGAALLVRQYYVAGYYPSGVAQPQNALQPSAALVKATLLVGAQNMTGDNTAGAAPSAGQGFGKVNLSQSLSFASDTAQLYVDDNNIGLQQAETFETTLFQKTTGPLRLALTWMDEPGVQGAQKMLVNNLDLELTDAQGNVYRGNGLAAGSSVPDTAADDTNVEEVIFLPQAAAGSYTVTVRGTNVPLGPQPFALVVRGPLDTSRTGKDAQVEIDPQAQKVASCAGPTCGETSATSANKAGGCQMGPDNGSGIAWLFGALGFLGWRRATKRKAGSPPGLGL